MRFVGLTALALVAACFSPTTDLSAIEQRLDDLEAASHTPPPDLTERVAALEAEVADLRAEVEALDLSAVHSLELDLIEVLAELTTVHGDVTLLQGRVTPMEELMGYLSVDPAARDIVFTGVNVHIRSGSGATDDGGAPAGLGNLVVGYDEDVGGDSKTGSHNVVIGDGHSYTSTGGLVAGRDNAILAPSTTVAGGTENQATRHHAAVFAGHRNEASAWHATVLAGASNTASNSYATCSGGYNNTATARYSQVTGGHSNDAAGYYGAIVGGQLNQVTDEFAVVAGGMGNEAAGSGATVAGGRANVAAGSWAAVSGGEVGQAGGLSSTVSGGYGSSTVTDYDHVP